MYMTHRTVGSVVPQTQEVTRGRGRVALTRTKVWTPSSGTPWPCRLASGCQVRNTWGETYHRLHVAAQRAQRRRRVRTRSCAGERRHRPQHDRRVGGAGEQQAAAAHLAPHSHTRRTPGEVIYTVFYVQVKPLVLCKSNLVWFVGLLCKSISCQSLTPSWCVRPRAST